MSKFQIQTRANDSRDDRDWSPDGLGEPGANLFDTREAAEAAITGLQALGGVWADACYRVVTR